MRWNALCHEQFHCLFPRLRRRRRHTTFLSAGTTRKASIATYQAPHQPFVPQIRLFGDPKRGPPVQSIKLTVGVETLTHSVTVEPTQNVICDFVDGYAFGDAIGLGVRSLADWWTVSDAVLASESEGIRVELLRPTRIAPSQMRIVPLRIVQTERFSKPTIAINLTLTSDTDTKAFTVPVVLPVKHLPGWSEKTLATVQASYFYAQEMPTVFSVFPPLLENMDHQKPQPPVLCLRTSC
jgi:hypothetical protein